MLTWLFFSFIYRIVRNKAAEKAKHVHHQQQCQQGAGGQTGGGNGGSNGTVFFISCLQMKCFDSFYSNSVPIRLE